MSVNLDSMEMRKMIDPEDMLSYVEQFDEQCNQGERLAVDFPLPRYDDIKHVIICGMGGSAIGGDILRAYASREAALPIEVVRNYILPRYVDSKSLVVVSSYSGNTEETLSSYEEAKKRSAKIVAITTGGKLAQCCEEDGFPYLRIPAGYAPRAALGFSFMPLLVFMQRWGFIDGQKQAIAEMKRTITETIQSNRFSTPESENPAKQLARRLFDTIPVIYAGEGAFQPVAARWRTQCNENAKVFARDFSVPEMNHNEILGWKNPASILCRFHVIYLLDKEYHEQIHKRFAVMESILQSSVHGVTKISSTGNGLLARLFSLIVLGDFTSVYLAYLYRQDPTPIPAIDQLKKALAQ
ncbi:MAG: bifunctional phosphoglucose/phosphomannose isomerase [Candidatus Omnitrophota bacterium]|jgi:glucose/mannose-6-phosphate isomerase|nr:MAG: bifunctional phosphoglucose/phosphomannose isomerase [Candidatus Omnitrophota bacterium]